MPYVKPQMVAVSGTINAIQSPGAGKGEPYLFEFNISDPLNGTYSATSAAYEADE